MPELSDAEDMIEVEFVERETGGTQLLFNYQSLVARERRLTNLEYKQKKKNIMTQRFMALNSCLIK